MIRDHIICDNRQSETTVHQKSYVNEKYKIIIYYNREYGELYDLVDDPREINNLWNNPKYLELKDSLLLKLHGQS